MLRKYRRTYHLVIYHLTDNYTYVYELIVKLLNAQSELMMMQIIKRVGCVYCYE